MTPAEAAAILRVSVEASPEEVEQAYRRRARNSHPDRLAGASPEEVTAAAMEFSLVAEAHEVLARYAVAYPIRMVPFPEPPHPMVHSSSTFIITGWALILFIASLVSYYGGALPLVPMDLILRLLPLTVVSIAFAVTGRRAFLATTVVLTAVSAGLTLAFLSFGSLLALLFLLIPVVGLTVMGRRVGTPIS